MSALEAGDADVIVEVPPSEVARLSKSNRVQVLSAVTSRNQWLRFNELKPPFEKPQVRRAAALATNRDAYIKGVMQGHATRARNIVGPGVVGYTELDPIPYDPAKAKELLAQAGLPGGFSTTMTCAPSDELICQAVVQDLGAVGINAKLQTLEWGTFLKYIMMPPGENEYQMSIVTRISQYLDADFPLYPDFHSANWRPKGGNHLFYKNLDVDRLLDATRVETDVEKRQGLFAQAMKQLWADLPVVPALLPALHRGRREPAEGRGDHAQRAACSCRRRGLIGDPVPGAAAPRHAAHAVAGHRGRVLDGAAPARRPGGDDRRAATPRRSPWPGSGRSCGLDRPLAGPVRALPRRADPPRPRPVHHVAGPVVDELRPAAARSP